MLEIIALAIGILAGVIAIIEFLPKVIKFLKRKKSEAKKGQDKQHETQFSQTIPLYSLEPGPAPGHLIHNLPFPRNQLFTGRQEYLGKIRKLLGSCEPVALYGQAGMGKSAIALEYCHENLSQYRVIWWLHSEDSTSLQTDLPTWR